MHGKGNFVRHPLRRLTYMGGHLAPDTDLHVTIRTTNLRARGDLIPLLGVPSRTPLTEFLCLTHQGESPHSLARIYVPRDLASAGTPWPRSVVEESQDQIRARRPTSEEAATLRISSTLAVLSITRVSTDTTGRVVEAALPGPPQRPRRSALRHAPHSEREKTGRMTSHNELRLLPWTGPDGKPCYLSTDDGGSHLSRLADNTEALHLDLAAQLLDYAADVLGSDELGLQELRALSADLTEALRGTLRVAESRGHRLLAPVPDTRADVIKGPMLRRRPSADERCPPQQ